MKILITILIIVLGLFFSHFKLNLSSCGCGPHKSFVDGSFNTKLVALVKIERYLTFSSFGYPHPLSMEVQILQTIKGEDKRKTIRVFGDDGDLCRPYVNKFKPGETWILGLYEGTNKEGYGQKDENKDDYFVWACNNLWVPVDSGIVTGYLTHSDETPEKEKMSVNEFVKLFNK